ncbi:MAG: hypothetical protein F4210_16575 [Holophagales bacterium]|nr:hypothetical protein [Holophagales bacterium]MYF97084.1 hypothetical protein [Holophagales bacterium]
MERSRSWLLALVLLCGSGLVAAFPLSAQAPGPCATDDSYLALDFLLGEWRLVSGGETVGHSRAEKLEDGCLIEETWSFVDGRSGRTYSSFDPAARAWRRFSVSNRGIIVRSDGTVDGEELVFDGEYVAADGRSSNWRERLSIEADGRIARSAGRSGRAGRRDRPSTVLFEGHYVPARTPEPRPVRPVETAARPSVPEDPPAPVAVAPPPTAPAAGDVTPGSARAVDAAVIERIAMASPMVLRVPLGAVESLPEGYGWITRDTAPYLCEGVTIRGVQIERRERRGRVELEVELAVHGSRAARRIDVGVDLRRAGRPDDDDPVASGATAGRVGRNIPEQIEHGSVAFELSLAMDAAVFDEIVAAAERPELVITLTVGR